MLSRDKRLPLDSWNLSEPQGNVFLAIPRSSIHPRHLIKEIFTPRLQVLSAKKYKDTCRKR